MALEVTRTRSKGAFNGTVVSFPKEWKTREGVVEQGYKTSLRWDKHHPLLENEKQIAEVVLGRGSNIDGRRFGKAGFFGTNVEDDAAEED
jgi:hypothetical protein